MNATTSKTRKWAAALIAGTGLIHLVLAPEYFNEQPYVGVLFLGGAAACGYVAAKLWSGRDTARDWLLGLVTAVGMFTGFVLSRTTGLPGLHESEWELSGVVSMVLEAGFAGIAASVLSRSPEALRGRQIATSGSAARGR